VAEPRIDDEELITLVLTLNQPDLRTLNMSVVSLPKTSSLSFRGMGLALLRAMQTHAEFESKTGDDPVTFFRRCFIERDRV